MCINVGPNPPHFLPVPSSSWPRKKVLHWVIEGLLYDQGRGSKGEGTAPEVYTFCWRSWWSAYCPEVCLLRGKESAWPCKRRDSPGGKVQHAPGLRNTQRKRTAWPGESRYNISFRGSPNLSAVPSENSWSLCTFAHRCEVCCISIGVSAGLGRGWICSDECPHQPRSGLQLPGAPVQ